MCLNHPRSILYRIAIDPPVKKPTGFDFFEVLGVFPVLKNTDMFHKCSTGKLNYRRSSIADKQGVSSLVRMAFSGNQSVVFIIALNKPGPPSSVYSLD